MKMKRPHQVPLSPQVLKLLEDMKPLSGKSEFIFPSPKLSRQINKEAANKTLSKIGYKGKLVARGLRSLASTILNEKLFNPDIIEAAMAHMDRNELRRTYNRTDYLDSRIELMNWWSNHIEESGSKI